ncbi:hypothetical protein B0T26DRAFT_807773 [Lasiosphaeria miniovina]|uniref:Uncharacterized protein n=1 Tax=Lasiosphaeria miniovina TaxID=1954250 RepID=A0AA40DG84_9PEZI|nr:uncharacterized protein B0T26DRAFT_807773 [Lasiosphaeria miniovina]KAK0701930.1 hypothetical protein B0T26DRAFT_807773 [Lasiosphaeria miniovina]
MGGHGKDRRREKTLRELHDPQTVDELLTAFDERRTEERQRVAREDEDRLARQRKITGQIIESRKERKGRATRAKEERLDRFEAGVREQEEWCRKRQLRRASPFYDEQPGGDCNESGSEDDQEWSDNQEEIEDEVDDDLARALAASRISERQERETRGRSSKGKYNAESPPARRRQVEDQRCPEPAKKRQPSTPINPPSRPRNQGAADSFRRPAQVQVPSYSGVPQHHQQAQQMPVPSYHSGYEQPYYSDPLHISNSDRPVAELEAVKSYYRGGNMAPPSSFNTNRPKPSRPSQHVHWSSPVARPASPGNYEDLGSASPYFHLHGHYPAY